MNATATPVPAASVGVTLFGGLELAVNGQRLTDEINRSQKLWSVLAYLLVNHERTVPQSEFIEVFWPDENSTNPGNALKTLLYRIRTLLEPYFDEAHPPILSQWGAYGWNRDIPCALDSERFEELCRRAAAARKAEERIALYREALPLYRGDFLPKLGAQLWVVPLQTRYHALYLEASKELASLLESAGLYAEMEQVCAAAIDVDSLDERLHLSYIRSLMLQGKTAAALRHYDDATDLLYRSLDIRPSQELRALYSELMKSEQSLETDLGVILGELRETSARPGAFLCEYGFFREIYRLEARRSARDGSCVHIALLTLTYHTSGTPPLGLLANAMSKLETVLRENLRRGDVVSKYSGAQYVVMLPSANFEDSTMVMERLRSLFLRLHHFTAFHLTYKIRALEDA